MTPQAISENSPATSCLINNHNYGQFVVEAVASAVAQTVPFDEIIVVDDGSTDDSVAQLQAAFGAHPRVKIIAKPNGGQLSAFNRGFAESTGELLFFLDADDLYAPTMLAELLKIYGRHPEVGLVFGPIKCFGQISSLRYVRSGNIGPHIQITPPPPGDCLPPCYSEEILFAGGYWDAIRSRRWVGSPTSALSFRRSTLGRFMPLACEKEWRIRADDCLLFGAGVADAPRLYQPLPLAYYRIHNVNSFFGSGPLTPDQQNQRQASLTTLSLAVLGRLQGRILKTAELEQMITGQILLEHQDARLFTKAFRQGWRAFRRAGLSKAAIRSGRQQFLANTLRRLISAKA